MGKIYSVRGATTVESDSVKDITESTTELITEIKKNIDFSRTRAVNLFITTTGDITAFYPARAVRESGLLDGCPLFSALEPPIENSLKKCIRVMLTVDTEEENFAPKHVYLHGAAALRPDLTEDKK